MNAESRTEMAQWKTILDLSTRMLEQAETRDWQSLEALMSARDRLLKLYFADGAAPGRVEMLKEQIAVIQANQAKIAPVWKGTPQLEDKEAGWSFKVRGRVQYDVGFRCE